MYDLLRQMKFHLITGFEKSTYSFRNDEDDIVGQGVLQGSSSAAPIFLLNSEISLSAYNKIGIGAAFCHPVDGMSVIDRCVQFVDDTSHFLNIHGARVHNMENKDIQPTELLHIATNNSQKWADLTWMSGGNLNLGKCFFYAFIPSINFKSNTIQYAKFNLMQVSASPILQMELKYRYRV